MAIHQAIQVGHGAQPLVSLAKDLQEIIAVLVREKYALLLVPAGIDMIESPRIFYPQLT